VSRWLPEARRRSPAVAALDRREIVWKRNAGDRSIQAASHAKGLTALARDTGCTALQIIVGHDLAVHWLQKPPAEARSLRELQLVAASRCAHLHGGSPDDWWVAADWDSETDFVCAAIPQATVREIAAQAQAANVSLQWTTAWLVAGAARPASFRRGGWNGLRTFSGAMLWHAREEHIDCIVWLAAPQEGNDLQATAAQRIALECARDGRLTLGPVQWENAGQPAGSEARGVLALAGAAA
jgi:hypothetical protein